MTSYEVAVRTLSSRNTHLKLRQRCRLALARLEQDLKPLPPDFFQKVNLAVYRRRNALEYRQRHFPNWDSIPEQWRQDWKDHYPVSGQNMAILNTALGLERQAEEAEKQLLPENPIAIEPTESQIDQMIKDYLDYRNTVPPNPER